MKDRTTTKTPKISEDDLYQCVYELAESLYNSDKFPPRLESKWLDVIQESFKRNNHRYI